MLDTDMCVYIVRRSLPQVRRRFQEMRVGEVVISAITYGELEYGAAKSNRSESDRQKIERVVRQIPVAPLDDKAGAAYGVLRSGLERQGRMIGSNDLWIGAHALSLGLTLVTNNEREFRRIDGLSIENWASS
jgi:tRNA(fMet)-specific endonuclease VapC